MLGCVCVCMAVFFFGAGLKTGWALKSGGLYHPQSGAGLKTGWTLKSGGLYHLKSGAGLKTGGLPTGFQTPVFTDLGALSARGICRKNEIPLHLFVLHQKKNLPYTKKKTDKILLSVEQESSAAKMEYSGTESRHPPIL